MFCQHGQEVCKECDFDGREDNNLVFGFDATNREPMSVPAFSVAKDGTINCKKHGNGSCTQCFGWKKQITKLNREAKKAGK